MKQSKTHIGFVNDHSGSMKDIAVAAMRDYNTNILAVKDAATKEELDTVVSVIGVGVPMSYATQRQVMISNPHVLRPMTNWSTAGGTPLYDGIADMIKMFEGLPDANETNVSFLVMVTTDGEEMHSQTAYKNPQILRALIEQKQNTGRWTFVFRVPKGAAHTISKLGVPAGNIQEWETTAAGMEKATAQTTVAMQSYMSQTAKGVRGSSSFFVGTANVNTKALTDVSADYTLYVVGDNTKDVDGMMISEFILNRRMQYLKGAAFYQLVKTESKVGPDKAILIQERSTGKIYGGQQARDMLGLPRGQNARLTPAQLGGYNIFIQSTSWNRKLPVGSGVLYNEKLGVAFSQEEIDRFTQPAAPVRVPKGPAAAQLPAVNNTTGRNIKSTMPKQPKADVFFATREDAREHKRKGGEYEDLGSDKPKGQRFRKVK